MKKAIVYVLKYGDETKLLAQADGTEKENLTLYDMLDTKTNLYAISEKCKTGTGKKQKAEMRIIIVDENNQPDKKWQFIGRLIDIDKEGTSIKDDIVKDKSKLKSYYNYVNKLIEKTTEDVGEK